ncbi:MAG: Ig-like domain-containing protein, partial [Methanocorpusculaceae archaeon]|nr:Ig-like domain-containing protein [Methanocorpusculaceae archaeon]
MTNNGVFFSEGDINGTSVSVSQFWNNQSFFENTLGWDFTNTWKMNSGNTNYQLPVLCFMETPVAGDVSYLTSTVVEPDDGSNPTPDPSPSDMLYINTEQHGYHGEDITLSGTGSAGSTLYFYVQAADDVNTITVPFRQLTDAGFPINTTVNSDGNWSITIPGSAFYIDAGVISPNYTFYVSTVSGAASQDVFTSCAMLSMSIPSPYLHVWGYGDDDGNVASGDALTVTGWAYGADSILYYLFGNNKIVTDTVSVSANEDFSISISDLPDGLYSLVIQHPMYDDRFNIVPNRTDVNGIEIDVEIPAGNYTESGTLFNVPSTSGIAYGSHLISAINELESMDAAVYIQILVGSLSLEINPLSDSVTKGTLIEISGTTNVPYGSNITVMYGLETASEPSVSYFITSGTETSDWNTTIDTAEFEPGIYVVAAQLTDYPDIWTYRNFTVLEPPQVPASITLDISSETIIATQNAALTPVVRDQNGEVIVDEEIVWTIEAVETVTQNNVSIVENTFNTLAAAWGTVNITATSKNNSSVSAMVSVFIEPLRAESVTITEKPSSALETGDTFQFQAEFKDQLGNSFIDLGYGWSSDNESVGTIDKASGLFTAMNPGTSNVTTYSSRGSASMTVPVSVVAAAPAEIIIEPASASVNCSETVSFTAVVTDIRGNVIPDAPVSWSVNTDDFGTIDSNGNFTAVASLTEQDGTVTVTAYPTGSPGITATATVTVIGFHATEILLTPASATLEVGDTTTLTAVVKDQFGNNLEVPVTWTSSNTAAGTVSEGVVTAVQEGTTTITASSGRASNTTEISVIAAIPRTMTLTVDKDSINATETALFTATVFDKNSNVIPGSPLNWTVSPTTAGTIENGLFTANKSAFGTVTITAQAKDNTTLIASQEITVIALHAAEITLTAVPATTLEVNETFQFTAEVRDQLGNLFDTTVSWESDNTSVGTIGAIGNFTAVSIGAVNITASVGDLRVTQPVSVVPAVPHEIIIDPATSILNASETVRLNVTIKDKRGDIIDSGFTWAKNTDEYGMLVDGVFTAGKLIEKNGEVIVTVTPTANESIHANATIKVNGFFATTVTITNKSNSEPVENAIELNPGQTYSFNATVKDQHDDDFPEGYANLTWKSSKTNVGTIVNGLFTAKEVGETTITAQSGNATKTVLIKVFEEVKPELDNVDIEHDSTEEMTSGKTVVNITVDTSDEKTEVKVDTKKNETTIKDKETNVTLVISFSKMENTTSGNSQS